MKWGSKNIKPQYGSKSIVAAYWGNKKVWDKKKPNIISFILMKKTYQAEEGMTFADWANSVYNIDGVNFINEHLFICNDYYYGLEGGYDKNSIIIDGYNYFASQT